MSLRIPCSNFWMISSVNLHQTESVASSTVAVTPSIFAIPSGQSISRTGFTRWNSSKNAMVNWFRRSSTTELLTVCTSSIVVIFCHSSRARDTLKILWNSPFYDYSSVSLPVPDPHPSWAPVVDEQPVVSIFLEQPYAPHVAIWALVDVNTAAIVKSFILKLELCKNEFHNISNRVTSWWNSHGGVVLFPAIFS